ncbi:MAG: TIGR03620 family F420-dependent LLM class oxidoreductase [Halieaceae bacterium]|jgi:probable F420-dependent oxidoreductase|nr:TIGR03620 family F420-dependent LLM class oxidoreductase [Halieaceae bacterium]
MGSKHSIGKLGIWAGLDGGDLEAAAAFAASIEEMGYGTLWIPEAVGRDPFVLLSHIAAATESLYLATGIANIYARDAMAMNAIRQTLNELSDGRLVLGLGVSHTELVSAVRHHDYKKPVSAMRTYLQQMDEALYLAPEPEKSGPLILAALREKMLGLAASDADGAHPYFVTPEHTARARDILGPDKLLAPEQKILLMTSPGEARAVARQHMATYMGLPNYRNNLLTLGFTEQDFDGGGSDRLVDAIVAWGDESELMKRIEAHWRSGADHVAIQCLRPDGQVGYDMDTVRAFAPGH